MKIKQWSAVRHFKPWEFDDADRMRPMVIMALDRVREYAGIPIMVTSDVRPEDTDSSHQDGWAVDIADNLDGENVSSRWRYLVLRALFREEIRRIGIYDRHIHIDMDPERDAEVVWWGQSD